MKKNKIFSLICLISLLTGLILPAAGEAWTGSADNSNRMFTSFTSYGTANSDGENFLTVRSFSPREPSSPETEEEITETPSSTYTSGSFGSARSEPTTSRSFSPTVPTEPQPEPDPEPDPEPKPDPEPEPEPKPDPEPEPESSSPYYRGNYGSARSEAPSTGGYYLPPTSSPTPTPEPSPEPEPEPEPDPEPEPEPDPEGPDPGNYTPEVEKEQLLLELVNEARAEEGLEPLIMHEGLVDTARLKSIDMIENSYFAHDSPTLGSTTDMVSDAGISYRHALENIGRGGSMRSIFTAFMNSAGHRVNILGSHHTHIGIGVYFNDRTNGYYVTQHFIQKP